MSTAVCSSPFAFNNLEVQNELQNFQAFSLKAIYSVFAAHLCFYQEY